MKHSFATLLATTVAGTLLGGAALADEQAAPTPDVAPAAAAPASPATPVSWWSTVKVGGHIDLGATFNPDGPASGLNFGHLFTDKANKFLANQIAFTIERDIDPKATGVDVGFKGQVMYGSDSRYTHFIGELDRQTSDLLQPDIVEAWALLHLPIFTKGGMDVKVGQYVTLEGAETIDPTTNFFYSHTYIFNFGIPFKHTGIMTTTHVSPMVDIYAGYDTGVNTSIGSPGGGYNANQFHFHGGVGLNFKTVTVLATTHAGPELPEGALGPGVNVHNKWRYLNDVVVTWKINDKLTSITDLNYIRDDGAHATGGGVAQYFTYPLNPEITLGVRGEVWRDNNGFYVAAFPGNLDYINAEVGLPNGSYGGGNTTYGAITVGLNIKPPHLPKGIDGTTVRPEIRYDRNLAGGPTFGADPGSLKNQITFGIDIVVPVAF